MPVLQSTLRFGAVAFLIFGALAGVTETRPTKTVPVVAVGPQYDTTHVYVAPQDVDAFVNAFLVRLEAPARNKLWLPSRRLRALRAPSFCRLQ